MDFLWFLHSKAKIQYAVVNYSKHEANQKDFRYIYILYIIGWQKPQFSSDQVLVVTSVRSTSHDPHLSGYYGCLNHFNPPSLMVKWPFWMVQWPFWMVKWPFLMVQWPFWMVQWPWQPWQPWLNHQLRLRHFDVWRSSWHCGPNVAPRAADAAARSAHLGNEDPTRIQRKQRRSRNASI